ncbi:MAG: hypothetical protein K5860_03180 [Bacteroidales bacterium]|nr:hypothetical protein [Bacteroidales bacterium]
MEERINQALQNIEKDLQNIKSAREQVELVVNSYKELQDKVQPYLKNAENLSQDASKIIEAFSEYRKMSLDDFSKHKKSLEGSCNAIVDVFQKQTNDVISHFKLESQEQLNSANAEFKKDTELLINDYKETQKQTSNSIQDSLITLKNEASSFAQICGNTTKSLDEKSSEIVVGFKENCHNIEAKIEEETTKLRAESEQIIDLGNRLKSSIDIIGSLNNNITNLMDELKKSQNAQDVVLNNIQAQLSTLNNSLSTISTNTATLINNTYNNIKSDINKLNKELKNTIEKNNPTGSIVGVGVVIIAFLVIHFIMK